MNIFVDRNSWLALDAQAGSFRTSHGSVVPRGSAMAQREEAGYTSTPDRSGAARYQATQRIEGSSVSDATFPSVPNFV